MKWLGLGVFASALAWAAWMPVADVDDRPLPPGSGVPRPVEFAYSADPASSGPHLAVVGLVLDASSWDAALLRFGTFDTAPSVRSMTIEGGGCVIARADTAIANNQFVEFVREHTCPARSGEAELKVTYDGPGRLAIWGAERTNLVEPIGPIGITSGLDGTLPGLIPDARVRVRSGRSDVPRLTLLAFAWQLRMTTLIALLLAMGLLLAAGLALLPGQSRESSPARRFTVRSAVGAGLVAGSIAAFYGVLIPPLQAPDEPAHLLTYADLAGGLPLRLDVRRLAERTHFNRIRFQPDEHFLPVHRALPNRAEWDEHEAAVGQMDRRSPVGLLLWRAAALVAPPFPAAHALLALRLGNTVFFGLATATAVLVLCLLTTLPRPYLLLAPVLLAPSVPFFAAGLSNYALVACASIVLGAGLLVFTLDGRSSGWSSWPIAASGVLLVATSHSALSLLPLLAAICVIRLILVTRDSEHPGRDAVVFWTPFAVAPWLWLLATTDRYQNEMFGLVAIRVPADAAAWLRWMQAHPALWIVPGFLGGVVEWARVRALRQVTLRQLAAPFAMAVGATVTGTAVLSLFVALPSTPNLDAAPVERMTYVGRVLGTLVTSTRLARFDVYLQDTFWARLGWLDTALPLWMEMTAVGLAGSLAVAGAVEIARRRDGRKAAAALAVLAGMLLSVGLYAAASHSMGRNLHGRYLLPVYVPALVLALASLLRGKFGMALTGESWIPLLMAWHAAATAVALNRYF